MCEGIGTRAFMLYCMVHPSTQCTLYVGLQDRSKFVEIKEEVQGEGTVCCVQLVSGLFSKYQFY